MATDMEYTRGGMEAGQENRAKTMVELHNERLRQEKEATAMKIVRALVPGLTDAVRRTALSHCQLDGERAAQLLKVFQAEHEDQLLKLHKESLKRKREREGSDDSKGSSSGSDGGSEDSGGSNSERERKSKRSKHKRRSKKDRKSGKARKDKKSSRAKEEKRKRGERSKRASSASDSDGPGPITAAVTAHFGKYGVIREADLEAKRGDFMVWAVEVAKVDPEVLPAYEEKELFATYMEDYNTATLPHRKYYDVAAYEARKRAKAAKRSKATERSAFNDEEEVRREVAARRAKDQQERLQQAYDELKHTDKAQEMREQQMLRAEMALAYRTGDHAKAERLALRLAPDEVQERVQQQKELAAAKGGG